MFDDDSIPCKVMVGFLFKRRCGRLNRVGCPYCKGQVLPGNTDTWQPDRDPYFMDRSMYPGYGTYDRSWSNSYIGTDDFTDYDGQSLVAEEDTDYERDLEAS